MKERKQERRKERKKERKRERKKKKKEKEKTHPTVMEFNLFLVPQLNYESHLSTLL